MNIKNTAIEGSPNIEPRYLVIIEAIMDGIGYRRNQ